MKKNALMFVLAMILTAAFGPAVGGAENDQTSPIPGVDVSHYQGAVDWEELKKQGIKFVYMKATQGEQYVDSMFEQHREGAKKAGMIHGRYHFFDPDADAKKQAEHFIKTVGDLKGSLPAVIDVEVLGKQSGKDLTQKVLTWMSIVQEELKHEPIIYSGLSFLQENLEPNFTEPHRLWVADYQKGHVFKKNHYLVFAQYSQEGDEKGIKGAVDMDWFEGTLEELKQLLCK